MKIIEKPISKKELADEYMKYFKTLTKAVVDIEKGIMAVDAELHADLEKMLLEAGSSQEDLWGINIYPHRTVDWFEYSALINIRPHQNNFSMEIEDDTVKEKIERIVKKYIGF